MVVERLDTYRGGSGGGPRDPGPPSDWVTPPDLGEFAEWLDRHGYSMSTQDRYLRMLDRCFRWLQTHDRPPPPRASWKDLRQFAEQEIPHTYASRQQLRTTLVAFGRCCGIKRDEINDWAIPCPRKPKGQYRGLHGKEDAERLLAAARTFGPRQYAACCALYFQALRNHEVAKMRWAEVDFHERFIRGVGKGAAEFRLPLHACFADALRQVERGDTFVLEGRFPGTHISPSTVWSWVRLAGERANLGWVTPHQLRHTAIAIVQDETGNLRTAMLFARHEEPKTTMNYTRTTGKQLRKGMEAL